MRESIREARCILGLALPVAVAQVGLMMLNVVDNVMLGHYGVVDFDACAAGRAYMMCTLMLGLGLVLGIDPLISQAHGAGDRRGMGLALQRGLVISLLISIPTAASWWWTEELVGIFADDPLIAERAELYALAQVPGIPFWFAFAALRSYLQGRGIMRPAMWVAVLANGVNWVGNTWLIFGGLGVPPLGVVGASIATCITQAFMVLALVAWVRWGDLARDAWVPWSREAWSARGLGQVAKIGTPVGLHIFLEVLAFHIVTFAALELGAIELAANQVIMQLASLSFMLPLGISMGTATRVGNLIGAGRPREAQHAAHVALALGGGVMTLSALLFFFGRGLLPEWFIALGPGASATDLAAAASAKELATLALPIAAAFQIFDGTQAVGCGILRGMGTTRPTAVVNFVGYYLIALPLAWYLGFARDLGLVGLWSGMAIGLFVVASSLVLWIRRRGPRHALRLATEGGGLA